MVALAYDTMIDAFCFKCERCYIISFNQDDMVDFLSGEPIQKALHYLSVNERELILSGICGECFDKIFALDNDE